MSVKNRKKPLFLVSNFFLFAFCMGLITPSFAAEYSIENTIGSSIKYDNNIRLDSEDKASLSGEVINASTKLAMNTERSQSSFKTALRFSEFDRRGFDSDDQFITLLNNYSGENYQFSLRASANHDTTRTSEDFDSGRVSNVRRKYYQLVPTWTQLIDEKNRATISATLSKTDYDSSEYTGNESGNVSIEWRYQHTENLSFLLRANASESETDGRERFARFTSDTRDFVVNQIFVTESSASGGSLGLTYSATEQLSFNASIGATENDITYKVSDDFDLCAATLGDPSFIVRGLCDSETDSPSSDVVNLNSSWQGEQFDLSAAYSVQTRPSSDGTLLEYKQAQINSRYRLSEVSKLNIRYVWGENTSLSEPDGQLRTSDSNRKYQSIKIGYDYKLTSNWTIDASLRYRYQERNRSSRDDTSESLSGIIGLSYRPQKKKWSY